MRSVKSIISLLVAFFVLVVLSIDPSMPFVVLFGWIIYPVRTLSQVAVEPVAFAVAGAALVLLIALVHGLASQFRWAAPVTGAGEAGPRPRWRFRWTLAGVFLILTTFAAAIAMVAEVHEVAWLLRADEPLVASSMRAARRSQSANNLKQIALAADNYERGEHVFPPGGTFNQYGEPQHSWETLLLPYLESESKPNLTLPWDHPENAKHFSVVVEVFVNPGIGIPYPDARGYVPSHYSANGRVMHANSALRKEDVTDGLANTILAGEVNAGFKAWGDPVNWRDPALGINASPHGFGGPPGQKGAQFVFMDGSVHFLREDIDPQVLRASARRPEARRSMKRRSTGRTLARLFAFVGPWSLAPGVARAGMGSVLPTDWERAMRLTDSAHARLEAISFFLAALLVSAVVVRWLWNRLAKDFARLPRLTFGKSLAVVAVWGLLFLVVLTMIATTREAMTPGSWRKVGMLYEVIQPPAPPPADTQQTAERTRHFERLKAALWSYAAGHDGRFPDAAEPSIPPSLWDVPGGAGLHYLYVPRLSVRDHSAILAYEPAVYGDDRLVLRSSGELVMTRTADIVKQLPK